MQSQRRIKVNRALPAPVAVKEHAELNRHQCRLLGWSIETNLMKGHGICWALISYMRFDTECCACLDIGLYLTGERTRESIARAVVEALMAHVQRERKARREAENRIPIGLHDPVNDPPSVNTASNAGSIGEAFRNVFPGRRRPTRSEMAGFSEINFNERIDLHWIVTQVELEYRFERLQYWMYVRLNTLLYDGGIFDFHFNASISDDFAEHLASRFGYIPPRASRSSAAALERMLQPPVLQLLFNEVFLNRYPDHHIEMNHVVRRALGIARPPDASSPF